MTPLEKLKAIAAQKKATALAMATELPPTIPMLAEPEPNIGLEVPPEALIPTTPIDDRLIPILTIMDNIELQLQKENPQIEEYMVKINQNLRSFPDLIHLLTDEQIAPLYKAMIKQAGIKLMPAKAKAKAKSVVAENFADSGDMFGLGG